MSDDNRPNDKKTEITQDTINLMRRVHRKIARKHSDIVAESDRLWGLYEAQAETDIKKMN